MTLFVKICGLKTEQDVDTAVEAGADAIGFVFSESPRRIDPATAARLAARVPAGVLTVGVFRREPLEYVRAAAVDSGIGAIQLHGPEDRAYYADLAGGAWTLIRAAAFGDTVPRCGELGEDLLLLDAPVPGSGIAWDWSRMPAAGSAEKWLLAGGLTPENVREAVQVTRPWGVDVSSGVEASRGVKDPSLITAFVEAARSGTPAASPVD
ncbi:phosphoribosylanthranilate isomerase [Streptomyces sp. NPDC047072]|uniref:phosphoribosylanthranilate isomerase n=1 Tax=Streptomyces sp. NPDC047072 TaxID=3154809 RepID=UPI0033C63E0C